MARLARIIGPGMSHHVTQRGNRRQDIYFTPEDLDGILSTVPVTMITAIYASKPIPVVLAVLKHFSIR